MYFFIFGFLGGVIRGVVGLVKYIQSYKDVEIRPWYFLGTVFISGLVGLSCAWIINDLSIFFPGLSEIPLSLALIMGYAGGDFIENIFKIIIKEPNFFDLGKKIKF